LIYQSYASIYETECHTSIFLSISDLNLKNSNSFFGFFKSFVNAKRLYLVGNYIDKDQTFYSSFFPLCSNLEQLDLELDDISNSLLDSVALNCQKLKRFWFEGTKKGGYWEKIISTLVPCLPELQEFEFGWGFRKESQKQKLFLQAIENLSKCRNFQKLSKTINKTFKDNIFLIFFLLKKALILKLILRLGIY
jgi:hypothetical protein